MKDDQGYTDLQPHLDEMAGHRCPAIYGDGKGGHFCDVCYRALVALGKRWRERGILPPHLGEHPGPGHVQFQRRGVAPVEPEDDSVQVAVGCVWSRAN